MSRIIEIETPRLLLGRWQESDLEGFIQLNGDPEVMRYFLEPMSRDQTKGFYDTINREFSERGYGLYAAEEKESGNFMGFIGFHWADFEADFCPCVEIGWRLKKDFWNKGYATEGARACLKHGFENLKLGQVYSFTAIQNLPSQRVMEKIGMEKNSFFEHPKVPEKHPLRPHVCYRIECI